MSVFTRLMFGIGILALLVLVFVGSSAAYLYVLIDAGENRLDVLEKSEELRRSEEFEAQIASFTQELVVLRDLKVQQYDPSFLVRSIVDLLPPHARLLRFQLVFEDETQLPIAVIEESPDAAVAPPSNAPTLNLQGIADTRRDVLDFQHAMEALPFVQEVEAPISNIIHPTDVSFSFTLTLVPPAIAQKVKIDASENVGNEGAEETIEMPLIEEAEGEAEEGT